MKNTCSKCPVTWVGLNICHCSVCHRTFSILRWFDAHRRTSSEAQSPQQSDSVGRALRGACADPAGLKHESGTRVGQPLMRLNEKGFWTDAQRRPDLESEAA